MLIEGKNVEAGSIIDINESSKQKYLSKGWGELLKQETKEKEVKVKKETKEFKISKETKDETNKD
jgi:hypothetical protein